jgi:CheY-like chemotaxis protein
MSSAVSDSQAALESTLKLSPDVVVLAISMPGMNGIEVAQELKRRGNSAKIVFLTVHEDSDILARALAAGGLGYVAKVRMDIDLIPAIYEAFAGRIFVSRLSSASVPFSAVFRPQQSASELPPIFSLPQTIIAATASHPSTTAPSSPPRLRPFVFRFFQTPHHLLTDRGNHISAEGELASVEAFPSADHLRYLVSELGYRGDTAIAALSDSGKCQHEQRHR